MEANFLREYHRAIDLTRNILCEQGACPAKYRKQARKFYFEQTQFNQKIRLNDSKMEAAEELPEEPKKQFRKPLQDFVEPFA